MVLRGGNKGFTFVELIFVVTILAILVAVSIPQLKKGLDSVTLQTFISDLTSFSRYAQAKAVNAGSECRVRFDLDKKILIIENRFVPANPSGKEAEEWRIERTKPIPVSVFIDLKKDSGKITFHPDGTSDEANFSITGASGVLYSVSVEQSTGYIDVNETK